MSTTQVEATLHYQKGDIFAALDEFAKDRSDGAYKGEILVPHVCNDQGAWGAGFVLGLSKWWDGPEEIYRNGNIGTHLSCLGTTQVCNQDNIWVVNMIAQVLGGAKPLRYAALGSCMHVAARRMNRRGVYGECCLGRDDDDPEYSFRIWCPKFGSGLAGGSWAHIEEMIKETWVEQYGINVTVFSR